MSSMPKEILIVKNITREGPWLLEEVIHEHGVLARVVDLDRGEAFPPVERYGAVVVLGGPDSAIDETGKMRSELVRIRETLRASVPYLGICLGMQTLVKAAGGRVAKNPVQEIGLRDPHGDLFQVTLTKAGIGDPLFSGLGTSFHVFHLHGETAQFDHEATLLATGKFCHHQIVRVGERAYGMQCHFELTRQMFEEWVVEDSDLQKLDAVKLREDFVMLEDEYTQTGRRLFENFLRVAGLV